MPLILAVEPDRRQASQIAAVLRGRPRNELVIAQSAAAALQAIGARVPDLLLTSPLLSRQDEERLAEWLSGLGAAAARVQALTIPILAAARPAKTTRGMLSVLRRRPRASNPDGCEPAMFADQVGLYLERAPAEPEESVPASPESDTAVSNRIEAVIGLDPLPADEDALWIAVPLDDLREEPVRSPEPALVDSGVDSGVDSVWMLTPVPEMEELAVLAPSEPPDTVTVVLLTPIYALLSEPVEAVAAAPSVDAQAPPPEVAAPPPEVVAPPAEIVAPPAPATTRRRKAEKPKPKPVQDEWGFFDPSQCGFAALVDKLDEITASGAASDKSEDVTVRVISY